MSKLKKDLSTYTQGSKLKIISTLLFNANFKAIINFRLASYLYRKFNLRIIPKWLTYRNRVKYAVDIDYRANIGGGFRILHGQGVVIGFDVTAGDYLTIYQGVTCGGNMGKTSKRDEREFSQPWLGNNVTIYANSVLIGPVYVGDNSIIGAGSIILKDIPANKTVFCKHELNCR